MLSRLRNSLVLANYVARSRPRLGATLLHPQPILKQSSTRSFAFSANRATGSKLPNDFATFEAGFSKHTQDAVLGLKNPEESVVRRKPKATSIKTTNQVRVNNVPFFVTAEEIRDFFTSCGPVLSVELETNQDGKFDGRVFVTFAEKKDAKAAVQLDRIVFRERSLRIAPVLELRPTPRLFVTNVPYTATEEDLRNLFSNPKPINIFFPKPLNGRPRGYVHVEFHSYLEAKEARDKYNRASLQGRPIDIFYADDLVKDANISRKIKPSPKAPLPQTLFVGNLDFEATESDLMRLFSEFEPVTLHILLDASGSPTGAGFVKFRSGEEAQRALEGAAGAELRGRPLRIERAKNHDLASPSDTLFVGNITRGMTLSAIKDAFAEFNVVSMHRFPRIDTHVHVKFRSVEDAQRAREAWAGKVLEGNRLKVVFARNQGVKGDGDVRDGSENPP